MPHFFISYSKQDNRHLALALGQALNAQADFRAVVSNESDWGSCLTWNNQVGVEQCDYVVSILSDDYPFDSPNRITLELLYAKALRKQILPMHIKGLDLENLVEAAQIMMDEIMTQILYGYESNPFNPQVLIAELTQIITDQPQNAEAYFERGMVFFHLDEHDQAITNYTRAFELNRQGKVYIMRMLAYSQRSLLACSQRLENSPYDVALYGQRGIAFMVRDNYEAALKDFNYMIKLDPNYADAYIKRSMIFMKTNDYEAVIQDLNKAIELNPVLSNSFLNRGRAYQELGRLKEALADYEQAHQLSPHDESILKSLSELQSHVG
jgi:tetratricopeptide (TPR) repeat protein